MGVAGFIVVNSGYSAAFLTLAAIAAAGLALFWFAMPETYTADHSAPADFAMEQHRRGIGQLANKAP
jgi:hypothetical protein